MRNTVELVEKARKDTLVLLDELGAGTDPTEGRCAGHRDFRAAIVAGCDDGSDDPLQ